MRTIVCLGHAALDRVYRVAHLPVGSTKVRATSYAEVGGGMAANAACAIARLLDPATHRVEFWGHVGGDAAGCLIRDDLKRYGVDTTHLRTFDGHTSSQSAVMVDGHGERMIVNYRGDIPLDDLSWLPFDRMPGVTAMLTDVRWLEGARAMLTAARAANVTAVLDADIGEPAIVSELVPLAGHAIFSEPGLHGWCGHDDVDRALRDAVAAGAGMAGVTLGERGTTLLLDEKLYHVPAFGITAVDTLGAGDVFHGAYTLALAEGRSIPDAARFASVAAAIKCTRHGGRQGCPSRIEVMRLLV